MITGYNTDVRYRDLVLHVQTEDKGYANPCMESLIYYGGRVVVAKRASYADLLQSGKGEEEIVALMDHQHRTMIKAIQAGKFDDKIREFCGGEPSSSEITTTRHHQTADAFALSEDSGRTLDQVILEYLTSEAEQEQLVLVLEEDAELRSGSNTEVVLRTRSSKSGDPIGGAQIAIKMISTFGGPRTLAAGETDPNGLVRLPLAIPSVERGTAALIITAGSQIGLAELKHLL